MTIEVTFAPRELTEHEKEKALRKIRCACRARATVFCDFPGCGLAMCAKHATRTEQGDFCREHKPGYRA